MSHHHPMPSKVIHRRTQQMFAEYEKINLTGSKEARNFPQRILGETELGA